MSRLVRLERRRPTTSVATAIASFLAEHDLSPGSQRVYAGALRSLQDGLGADTPLAMLDEPGARKRLAAWFRTRDDQTEPGTRVRQLAILPSACAFWRRRAWLTTDPTTELDQPMAPLDRTRALTRDQIASLRQRDEVALRERVRE